MTSTGKSTLLSSLSRLLHAAVLVGLLAVLGVRLHGQFWSARGSKDRSRSARAEDIPRRKDVAERARQAFVSEDWELAAETYRQVVEQNAGDVRAWWRLGYALHVSGRIDEAIPVHMKVCEFSEAREHALYNLACAYALKGEKRLALGYLRHALDSGFRSTTSIVDDPDLNRLAGDPEFEELAERALPLSQHPVARQFAFLQGHWNVIDMTGKRVGRYLVTEVEERDALWIEYTGSRGTTSTAILYLDSSDEKWHKVAIGVDGNVTELSGGYRSGRMELRGHTIRRGGQSEWLRASFQPVRRDRVRMIVRASPNDGSHWMLLFDGSLSRRKE